MSAASSGPGRRENATARTPAESWVSVLSRRESHRPAALTADGPGFEPVLYPGASSALSAAVGYAGVYDFHALDTATDVPAGEGHRAYLGGGPDDEPAAYDLASPVGQVNTDAPPTLLLHGSEDDVVPPSQSELLADALGPMTDVVHETVPSDHGYSSRGPTTTCTTAWVQTGGRHRQSNTDGPRGAAMIPACPAATCQDRLTASATSGRGMSRLGRRDGPGSDGQVEKLSSSQK